MVKTKKTVSTHKPLNLNCSAKTEKEYITFREMEHKGKTKKFAVVPLKNQEDILGIILWSGGWRSYVLEINERTQWSTGCLKQIYNFISKLMEERHSSH